MLSSDRLNLSEEGAARGGQGSISLTLECYECLSGNLRSFLDLAGHPQDAS